MPAPTASRVLEERIAALEGALDRLCPDWRRLPAGGRLAESARAHAQGEERS